MQTITPDNLSEFRPSADDYATRRDTLVPLIGVTSDDDYKDFRGPVKLWNEQSAIGWSKEERNVIALILSEEQANTRFAKSKFIHPQLGGDTGEHPMFIGLKIDGVRSNAGLGAATFDADPEKSLITAKLCQKLHTMAVLHDIGELVDISHTEAKAVGASGKEPPEEALVGPFKIRLACYAISQRDPSLYYALMRDARDRIRGRKDALFNQALRGEISGDDFVTAFGHEIGTIITEATAKIASVQGELESQMQPSYRKVSDDFVALFDETQTITGFDGNLFHLFDKMEGDAHLRHFAGRGPTPPDGTTPILDRLFPDGKITSYHFAASKEVIGSITYAQKTIPMTLAAAEAVEDGPQKEVALAMARAGSAELLRNHIRLLCKSPPFIDMTQADQDTPAPEGDWNARAERLGGALHKWRSMKAAHQPTADPLTELSGLVKREAWMATLDKMASAIERGDYVPTKADLPLAIGKLPPCAQPTEADIADTVRRYAPEPFITGEHGLM